ncbi:MAG: hypothetical protein VKQ33_09770 [Candidatus Sericytochromatia bacterium]|nr:hypothetical protein [Candidatus Sericytochromatia bacterium]
MDDLKARLKQAEAELEKVKHQLAVASRQLQAALRQAQAVQEYAEAEHSRVAAEPASERQAARLVFAELRLLSAAASLEVAQLAASLDLLKPIPPATKKRIDDLSLYIQFIGFEMNLARYQPVRHALGISLGLREPPEAPPPVPAPAPARPGLAGRPGPAARPGLPRPPGPGGTGPLPRPGGSPAAPRPALPPRPASLARPAGGPSLGPPQRPGTGPLRAASPGLPSRPGTRPLDKPAGLDPLVLAEELRPHVAVEEVRQKLRVLYDRLEEVEAAVAPLRGPSTGELSMPCEQASGALRQLAGKVYFIHRAVAALEGHGDLATKLAFEITEVDPKVQQILLSLSPEAVTTPAPPAAEPEAGPLGARLRSIFKG